MKYYKQLNGKAIIFISCKGKWKERLYLLTILNLRPKFLLRNTLILWTQLRNRVIVIFPPQTTMSTDGAKNDKLASKTRVYSIEEDQ